MTERVMGIEPTSLAWEARALPLSYTRVHGCTVPVASGVRFAMDGRPTDVRNRDAQAPNSRAHVGDMFFNDRRHIADLHTLVPGPVASAVRIDGDVGTHFAQPKAPRPGHARPALQSVFFYVLFQRLDDFLRPALGATRPLFTEIRADADQFFVGLVLFHAANLRGSRTAVKNEASR